jgi:hypothetical protein
VQRLYWGRAQQNSNVFTDAKVNADGSYYVTGYTGERPDLGTTVGLTYKFNADGTQAWGYAWYIDATTKQALQFSRIAVSGTKVFFAGQTKDASTGWDVRVLGFTPDGLNPAEASVAVAGDDTVSDAKADANGNLLVAGTIDSAGATVVKFNSNLGVQWRKTMAGTATGRGTFSRLALASDGTVYAAGTVANTTVDSLAASFGADGTVRWTKSLDEAGANAYNDVTLDLDGNPVFVGNTASSAPVVRKLKAADGSQLAAVNPSLGGYVVGDVQFATTTATGVAFAGVRKSSADSSYKTFVTQLNSAFTQAWTAEFVPPVSADLVTPVPNIYPSGLTTDGVGGLYLAANGFTSSADGGAAFATLFDKFGSVRWSRFRQGPARNAAQWNAISANSVGRVLVAGQFSWPLIGEPTATQGAIALLDQGPILYSDVFNVPQFASLTVRAPGVLANDVYVGDGKVVLVKAPDNGTLKLNDNGSFNYIAPRATTDDESFQYAVVRPGFPQSDPVVALLRIVGPPIAVRDNAQAGPGLPATIDVLANDSDLRGLPLSVTAVTAGTQGTTSISRNKVIYTPTETATGFDSFSYTVSNGVLTSTTQVTVKILPDPFLGTLRPGQAIAGQKSVTIQVLGRNLGLEPGSVVFWNGSARTTTYVSETEVDFLVKDIDIALEGNAKITVKNVVGRVSNALSLPIVGRPAFTISAKRQADNSVLFSITNSGTGTATNLVVQSAITNGVASLSNPAVSASLAPKKNALVYVPFPASAFSTPRYATCVITLAHSAGTVTRTVTVKY